MDIRTLNLEAPSITTGDATVTPRSQTVVVELPFAHLELSRPTDVIVERPGRTERHDIVDVTRLIQIGSYAAAIGFVVLTVLNWAARRGRALD